MHNCVAFMAVSNLVLGDISIFGNIVMFHQTNISYCGYSWISKYRISILIVFIMLNKNTWGVKSVGPIRSNIANRQV